MFDLERSSRSFSMSQKKLIYDFLWIMKGNNIITCHSFWVRIFNIWPWKVTNRKLTYDFLWVINRNIIICCHFLSYRVTFNIWPWKVKVIFKVTNRKPIYDFLWVINSSGSGSGIISVTVKLSHSYITPHLLWMEETILEWNSRV